MSLSGKPLDPYVISTREIQSKDEERRKKENRGFFNYISKKFSQAANWHFGNNPTRKIKTSHLRVKSSDSLAIEEVYSQILNQNEKNSLNNTSNLDDLNNSIKIDENNIYGFLNTLNLKSEVLAFNNEYAEPSKLVKVVSSLCAKKDNSFFKQIKKQFDNDNMTYFVKDKPAYKQASKDYSSMY